MHFKKSYETLEIGHYPKGVTTTSLLEFSSMKFSRRKRRSGQGFRNLLQGPCSKLFAIVFLFSRFSKKSPCIFLFPGQLHLLVFWSCFFQRFMRFDSFRSWHLPHMCLSTSPIFVCLWLSRVTRCTSKNCIFYHIYM